ncbi:hypothetical protein Gdia_2480 [Gluconacetobacter diazotrophicus PA1 5]|uniref:hypothetical protein n=1 Tax=Gluconacetobacter diazotrophicus TaxID=33996 RepID=UPI000173D8DB|nr:hypothetical protein [Gluconacetobacter diazotrophicus]ACI52225.1 hypothetical protein Gdia_2480 [Gluconacetobacter diazotrophicus PA1 5]
MSTVPSGYRIVYARPKYAGRMDSWSRVAKCRHAPPELDRLLAGGDMRVWRGVDGNLVVLAISPALEAR